MSTVPTQIRIDKEVKKQASALFAELGMDMSGAVNIFLHQCLIRNGLPFDVKAPHFNHRVQNAMDEARRISHDPSVKSYDNMADLKKALEE